MGAYHSCNTFSQPIAHYSLLMVKSDRVTYSSSLKGSSYTLALSLSLPPPFSLFISLALSGHNVSCLFAVISAGWINVLSGLFQRQLLWLAGSLLLGRSTTQPKPERCPVSWPVSRSVKRERGKQEWNREWGIGGKSSYCSTCTSVSWQPVRSHYGHCSFKLRQHFLTDLKLPVRYCRYKVRL